MTDQSNPSYASRVDQLQAEWSPKNVKAFAEVTSGSAKKYLWQCTEHHQWETTMKARVTGGTNCPFCSNQRVWKGYNDLASQHPSLVSEWSDKNEVLASEVTSGSKKRVWWECAEGHEWQAPVYARASGRGCPYCSGRQSIAGVDDLTVTDPHIASEWHPTKNIKPASAFRRFSHHKAWWQCDKGHEWESEVRTRVVSKTGCMVCATAQPPVSEDKVSVIRAEWSEKNGVTFDDVSLGSGKRYRWKCGLGHEWEARIPDRLKKSQGCPFCANKKVLEGFNDLATTYPELAAMWDYENNEGVSPALITRGSNKKVNWVCPEGHQWSSAPKEFKLGRTVFCPYCSNAKVLTGFNDLATTQPEIASEWHPTKNAGLTPEEVTEGSNRKAWWQCEAGHEWETVISNRRTRGCPYCGNKAVWSGFNDLATTHPELSKQWHPANTIKPSELTYGSDTKVKWVCDKGHEWDTLVYLRTAKLARGCPTCGRGLNSKAEKEVAGWMKALLPNNQVEENTKSIIPPFELDVHIPEKNLAVEYNGLYWHTESQGKDKWYHHKKWAACQDKGIQLIQIWEDDWNRNPDLVKKMIAHKLGVASSVKAYARKCKVVRLSKGVTSAFLNANHIQGSAEGSVRYGLEFNDAVVAVMVLKSEPGSGGKALNLLRFATSVTVPGGFTKLLRSVLADYPEVTEVVTFSDNCVSDGGLYENNGFVAVKQLDPDYMYVVNGERKHKFGYRLVRFRNDPELQYVEGLTEKQLAELNGLERVWDAGKTKWVLRTLIL